MVAAGSGVAARARRGADLLQVLLDLRLDCARQHRPGRRCPARGARRAASPSRRRPTRATAAPSTRGTSSSAACRSPNPGMKDHPLTPMRDSNLVRVLGAQTPRRVGLVPFEVMRRRRGQHSGKARSARAGSGYAILDAPATSTWSPRARPALDLTAHDRRRGPRDGARPRAGGRPLCARPLHSRRPAGRSPCFREAARGDARRRSRRRRRGLPAWPARPRASRCTARRSSGRARRLPAPSSSMPRRRRKDRAPGEGGRNRGRLPRDRPRPGQRRACAASSSPAARPSGAVVDALGVRALAHRAGDRSRRAVDRGGRRRALPARAQVG